MSNDEQSKAKMAPKPGTPPGTELDGHGQYIPFDQRTEDDKRKIEEAMNRAIQGDGESDKK